MNESVFKDIYGSIDKKEAEQKINELKKDPHEELISSAKEIFPYLGIEKVREILKKHNFQMDDAILELEENNQKYEEKKQAELLYENNKKFEEKCKKEVEEFADIFNSIDPEIIKQIYLRNNYDLNKTSDELYDLVQENERKSEENLKMDIQKKKENMKMSFAETYKNLTEEEILQEIESNNMMFDKIDPILSKRSIKRYLLTLIAKFQNHFTREEIEEQFKLTKYNYEETINNCLLIINKKNNKSENPKVKQENPQVIQENIEIPNKPVEIISSTNHNDSFTYEYNSEMKEKSKMIFIKFNEKENNEKNELKEKIRQSIKNHLQKINTIPSPNTEQIQNIIQKPTTVNLKEEKMITCEIKDDKIHAKINFHESKYYCYVGFYLKGDSTCILFDYLYNLKNDTFVVDKPLLNGDYEFRLFNKSSFLSFYSCYYTSDPITISDKDFVTFQKSQNDLVVNWEIHSFDPLKSDAFVGIFLEEENRPKYYIDWNWIKGHKGSLHFRFPKNPGSYQARVFAKNDLKISNALDYIQI